MNCIYFCSEYSGDVCMYVCIKMYVRTAAYSLDCHESAMINCRLYRTFKSLSVNRTETVISSCRELSVVVSSTVLGKSTRNFVVHSDTRVAVFYWLVRVYCLKVTPLRSLLYRYTVPSYGLTRTNLACRSWSFLACSCSCICLVITWRLMWSKWVCALWKSRIFCACSSLCLRDHT